MHFSNRYRERDLNGFEAEFDSVTKMNSSALEQAAAREREHDWVKIAAMFVPTRTPMDCRIQWENQVCVCV